MILATEKDAKLEEEHCTNYSRGMLSLNWTCPHCWADFQIEQDMILHDKSWHHKPKFTNEEFPKCPKCEIRLESYQEVLDHFRSKHFKVLEDAVKKVADIGI